MSKSKLTPAAALNVLMRNFMLNPFALSKAIRLSNSAVLQILKGKGKITVPTALRLAKFFGQAPSYWLDLQRDVDLAEAAKNKKLSTVLKGISKVQKPKAKPKAKAPAKGKAKAKAKPKSKAKAKAKAKAKPKAKKK